jgi:hypothetical protein
MRKKQGPRYGPHAAYKTRPSASEIAGANDFAATALDRPLIDIEEMRTAPKLRRVPSTPHVEHTPRFERTPHVERRERGASLTAAACVLSLSSLAGAICGALFAIA